MRDLIKRIVKCFFKVEGLIAASILITSDAGAATKTPSQVRSAVETWVRHITADAREDASVEKLISIPATDSPMAYIAELGSFGYCVCAASDSLLPVYFYCPNGVYDPANPGVVAIVEEVKSRALALREAATNGDAQLVRYSSLLADRVGYWRMLESERVPPTMSYQESLDDPVQIELPLRTEWDQSGPYNNQCPAGQNGGTTLVGCVATATAQIMRYWEWPPAGVGNGAFNWNGDNSCAGNPSPGQVITCSYADAYDWSNMPNICLPWSPPLLRDAVAELCFEVGVAIEMDFGECSSGSFTTDVPNALSTHFRYHGNVTYVSRDSQQMTEEIQWMRPLALDGFDGSNTGHCWVVYGYNKGTDPDRQFRMNMGWGGNSDGWYSCDAVPLSFTNNQRMVIRIAPGENQKFVGASTYGDGSPSFPIKDLNHALSNAADGTTLILKAGSVNSVSAANAIVSRPLTIKGVNVTITKQ